METTVITSKETSNNLWLEIPRKEEELRHLSEARLRKKCDEMHISHQGNKSDMIQRILIKLYPEPPRPERTMGTMKETTMETEKNELTQKENELRLMSEIKLKKLCNKMHISHQGNKSEIIHHILEKLYPSIYLIES